MLCIRPATKFDAEPYWKHSCRHELESGREGDPIFSPIEEGGKQELEEFVRSQEESWEKPLSEPGWERTWILTDEIDVFGDVELAQRPAVKSALHRATLTIGIERPYRGQGHGSKLMEIAIGWARAQAELDWIQLSVFEGNEAAKALYRKFGFMEVSTTPDMFRLFGRKLADTSMILKLR